MFSDTHCHLSHIEERGENLEELLTIMSEQGYPFVLDIGTKPHDFDARVAKVRRTCEIPPFLHFSCGLWPAGDVIADRKNALLALEEDLAKMFALSAQRSSAGLKESFAALGECGLDHYWNGQAALEREGQTGEEKGTTDLHGEEELFECQLEIARKNALAVIVHSRDAFDSTLGCIKNGNWDKGVIHCYSYGIEEARSFLDRGWYISFPGNITWAKKQADKDRLASLIRYIPRERLLLETDAPYLSPAPHRGKTNTPLLIAHTYEHVATILGLDIKALGVLVYENAKDLFLIGQKL